VCHPARLAVRAGGSLGYDRRVSVRLDEYLRGEYRDGMARRWPQWAKGALTTGRLPIERRRAKRLADGGGPLRLHLGCSDVYLENWVNVDLADPRHRLDLCWDLRRGIPFADGSAEAVFSEHLFEHIGFDGGLALMRECHRVLRPGGVLRITVPDLERYVRSYLGDDPLLDECRTGRPTRAMAFEEVFFHHGHRAMYDFETLALMLRSVGFTAVEKSTFRQSRLADQPDRADRRPETLYVEAVK
jgi:predicted SAM-dependent methyltransferase